MGPACARSRALPCGTPSMTSMRTTSPSSRSTAYLATEAPTLPAPTTVIFGRRACTCVLSSFISSPRTAGPQPRDVLRLALRLRHVLDDGGAELRALHFSRSVHQAREVVGDHPGLDRLLQTRDDPIRRVGPSHVAQHHLAREDHRAGVDLVLPCVLRRGPVRRLEERVPGTAPKYAGQDKVNPGSVILSGEMMLRYMGWTDAADRIIAGLEKTIQSRVVTYDFARLMDGAREVKCSEFGTAIIQNMAKP